MKRRTSLVSLALALTLGLSATHGFAADDTAPVKTLIDLVAANWKAGNEDYEDYFSDERLDSLYSAEFSAAYREASKHPAMDVPDGETGSPFDYDVMTNSQDGCPLEDIRIEGDGEEQVTAMFDNTKCAEWDANDKHETTLIFHVQEENGRPVIDDIFRVEKGNSGQGLKEQMLDIAKAG